MRRFLKGAIPLLCALQLLAGCNKLHGEAPIAKDEAPIAKDEEHAPGPGDTTTITHRDYAAKSPGYMEIHGLLEDGGTISSDSAGAGLSITQASNANEKDLLAFYVSFSEYEHTGTTETITEPGSTEPIVQEKIIETSAGIRLYFEVTPAEGIGIITGKHDNLPDQRLPIGKIKRYGGRINGLDVEVKGKDYFSIGGSTDVTYDAGNLEGTFEIELVTKEGKGHSEPQTVTGKFRSDSVRLHCHIFQAYGPNDGDVNGGMSGGARDDSGDDSGDDSPPPGSPGPPPGPPGSWKSAKLSHEFCKQYF